MATIRFRSLQRALGAAILCGLGVAAAAAPDEELLGKSRGYPMGTRANWYDDQAVRVGWYTNLDKLFPGQHHVLRKADAPSPLPRAAPEPMLKYRFQGRNNTIDDYLAHQ